MHKHDGKTIGLGVLLLLILGIGASASGQDCLDYSDFMHWTGMIYTGGDSDQVVFDGAYAYAASGHMTVIDCSDPSAPVEVSSVDTPGYVAQVFVKGDYAYVADRHGGMQLLNISAPSWPWIVSAVPTDGDAVSVTYTDGFVYVGDTTQQLYTVDVSNPDLPTMVDVVALPGIAQQIAITNGVACLATYSAGLCVFDVSVPQDPVHLTTLATPSSARGVVLDGGYAYIACHTAGLVVVDMTTPADPDIVAMLPLDNTATGVDLADGFAFLATGVECAVVDVSDPLSPQLIGKEDFGGTTWDVAVADGYACVVDDQFHMAKINNPDKPDWLTTLTTPGTTRDMDLVGDLAFLANQDNLQIVDVSDPSVPTAVGSLPYAAGVYDVAVQDDHVYAISDYFTGVLVIDVADVTAPEVVTTLPDAILANTVETYGHALYIATMLGFRIYDCSDPAAPVFVGNLEPTGMNAQVFDDHLYVSGGGVHMFDLTDPLAPLLLGSATLTSEVPDLDVQGDVVFAANVYGGLQIIDFGDPANAFVVGQTNTQSRAYAVDVVGDIAYVADNWTGLTVVDVSDVSAPAVVGTMSHPVSAEDVVVTDDAVLLAAGDLLVALFDCDSVTAVPPTERDTLADTPLPPRLLTASPNPFNPRTVISFAVGRRQHVNLAVFDLTGRKVIQLVDGIRDRGVGEAIWKGIDQHGRPVPSGLYFVSLVTDDATDTQKLVLAK